MKIVKLIARLLITVSTPFVFLMLAVRLLLTPVFLEVEYRTPNFPADPYGFTMEDRLQWSKVSIQYLVNNQGIEFLSTKQINEGTPLFNARELSHMLDVKILVQQMLKIWMGILVFWLVTFLWAWRGRWMREYFLAVSNGGWLTLAVIVTLLIFVAIDFDALFTAFHQVFFTGDTWLFYFSDNLIRLFPMRFWRDAFILTGGLTIGLALISALSRTRLIKKKVT